MIFRKVMSLLLTAVLFVSSMTMAAAAAPDTVQGKLSMIEKDTYGTEQTGAVLERINKLETAYNGSHMAGSMMARVDAIYDQLYSNGAAPSLLAQVNAVEWNIYREVSMTPVDQRIANLELEIAGKTEKGSFVQRITGLSELSFGDASIPMVQTMVPANTLVKIALVTPVNAKNLKAGDTIRYKVAADVFVDGNLVFAKGEPGIGTVQKVTQAKNFGRNAEVEIDFATTKAIDGTDVETFLGEESKQEMKNMAMAAGASVAGMVLLGPIGIVAGAFVKGKNVDVPEGTEMFIQTKVDTTLYGVQSGAMK